MIIANRIFKNMKKSAVTPKTYHHTHLFVEHTTSLEIHEDLCQIVLLLHRFNHYIKKTVLENGNMVQWILNKHQMKFSSFHKKKILQE
jgi:hypothetical protein